MGNPETFKIRSTNPDGDVIFYPYTREDTKGFFGGKIVRPNSPLELETTEISAHASILTMNTTKPKGSAGSFSVSLASDRNWKGLLHSGCWCLIYMSDRTLRPLDGEDKRDSKLDDGLKMIGIVKSVNRVETTNPSSGIRTIRYDVTGIDFHGVFDTQQYLNAHLGQLSKKGGDATFSTFFLGYGDRFKTLQKPDDLVKNLIDVLIGRPAFLKDIRSSKPLQRFRIQARAGQPFRVPKQMAKRILGYRTSGAAGNLFSGMITFFLQRNLLGRIQQKPELMGTFTTWSILESYANKLLNELYTDLLPVNLSGTARTLPAMVFRAIPFSSDRFPDREPKRSSIIKFSEAGKMVDESRFIPTRVRGQAVDANEGEINKKTLAKWPKTGDGAHFYVSRSIEENEIFGIRSGKSDNERFNFFLVSPNLSLLDHIGENAIIATLSRGFRRPLDAVSDMTSISRYGLRTYVAQSNYIDSSYQDLLMLNRIVKDLWEPAHMFESGTVSLVGVREHIPVGTNIVFEERQWIAHVEQVSNDYSVDPNTRTKSFRTNISFVRLQTTSGRPIDLVENGEEKNKAHVHPWDRGAHFTRLETQTSEEAPPSKGGKKKEQSFVSNIDPSKFGNLV
jgi:hypothetical protein